MSSEYFTDKFKELTTTSDWEIINKLKYPDIIRLLTEEKKSSISKGKTSETEIEKWLNSIFHKMIGYEIQNITSTSKSGDFKIIYTPENDEKIITILIEVKNHKSTITTKDIEKFDRDIEKVNPTSAIMISCIVILQRWVKT